MLFRSLSDRFAPHSQLSLRAYLRANRVALLNVAALSLALIVTAFFTGWNMFGYPHYESDEGTYVGSAWAMFTQGALSYYTYNYDHPPFGWFQIGAWTQLFGGFSSFGMSVNSGRMLMLVVTLLSTLVIYMLVQRTTDRIIPALLAALLFAVSPIGVSLHRQVWIDNLATLWLLLALYCLATAERRLDRIVLSALCFGLAFWTKEVFVVFLPGLLYLAFRQAHQYNRRFAGALWLVTVGASISLFLLMALLKDELLPPGVLWSSPEPHVSLIDTLRSQAARGGDGSLLDLNSQFWGFFQQWRSGDPLLIMGGLAALGLGVFRWRYDHLMAALGLMCGIFLLFLGRGGVVLYYYVIPLLALFAVAIGLLLGWLGELLARRKAGNYGFMSGGMAAAVAITGFAVPANVRNFQTNSTAGQTQAAQWIAGNLSHENVIIMDSYAWVDLREPEFTGGPTFEDAHYFWPAVTNPTISGEVLGENWRNIDYIAFSPSTQADVERENLPLIAEALEHSDEVQLFHAGDWTVKILRPRTLRQQPVPSDPILMKTWESYKQHFIFDGRVIDPYRNGNTTSEGQAYALTRAVYAGDRRAFDTIWTWTQENLRTRGDALFGWLYGQRADETYGVIDPAAATDADVEIALALLMASQRWDEPAYAEVAQPIMEAIWEQETAIAGDWRVLTAGDWAANGEQIIINPSYLMPYAYRIFAEADPERPWMQLVDSSYYLLDAIRAHPELGAVGLVPDWAAVNRESGAVEIARSFEGGERFSFDASRMAWRIALDWMWFQDDRAREWLGAFDFPRREISDKGRMLAAYYPNGAPAVEYEATSMYAGVIPALLFSSDPDLAHRVYAERIFRLYTDEPGFARWGDPQSYYDQNWAWFTTALMNGGMSNLWAGEEVVDWDKLSR